MNTKTTNTNAPGQLALGLTTPALAAVPKGTERAERPTRRDRLDAARAVLARGLAGVRDDPAALRAYLAFRARFRDYSPRNALLIWMQRPTARYCMGFRTWTKHGRRVRKGERGITVLAPVLREPTAEEVAAGHGPDERVPAGYRTATTFDYEQTEPTRDDAPVYAPPVPRLDADGPAGLVDRLEAAAGRAGCRVHYSSLGYADGWYREADRTICVRAGLSGARPGGRPVPRAGSRRRPLYGCPDSRGRPERALSGVKGAPGRGGGLRRARRARARHVARQPALPQGVGGGRRRRARGRARRGRPGRRPAPRARRRGRSGGRQLDHYDPGPPGHPLPDPTDREAGFRERESAAAGAGLSSFPPTR